MREITRGFGSSSKIILSFPGLPLCGQFGSSFLK